MREHSVNSLDNFIAGWYLDDTSLCDSILEYHKQSPLKSSGKVFTQRGYCVDKSIKDSVDIYLDDTPFYGVYNKHLQDCVDKYIQKYNWCNMYAPWKVIEPIIVQQYPVGGTYHTWHAERTSSNNNRHLVFITYMNDITDDGETEFFHQKFKIKPEKGLTIIFPTDWTFTHRGVPSPSQEKTIVTGWFNFI